MSEKGAMTRKFVKGWGPSCPHCGHIKSSRMGNGWSEPNDDYLRYKKCDGCGEKFVTVEVIIPPDSTTFYRLDHHGRRMRRERWRRRFSKTGRHIKSHEERSDQLFIRVRVKSSADFDPATECWRGHKWTPENTYVTPSSKYRRCRLCRDISAHAYYLTRRDNWNKKRDAKLAAS